MSRYARQMILPEVGTEGQKRLCSARILVIGTGGLGVPALQYLAGAGVGHITLIDPDVVERGNLHRQPLYVETDIGTPKATAAATRLTALNPDIRITPHVAMFDPANAPHLIAGADLVLDCADSFAASYVASDVCMARHTPLISASALALSGYAGGFCAGAPSLRAVFPDLPDTLTNCATSGVLGPVVGLIGALQAQLALSVLLDLTPSPLGQMLRFDAATLRFSSFRFDTAPEPVGPRLSFLAPDEMTPSDFIVDLRDTQETPHPVTPTAHRHLVEDFGANGPHPAPDQRAVFCCRSGLRAWRAAERLRPHWAGEIKLVALGDPT